MSETVGEHQNAVGTNKTISLEEMNIKTESFEKYKTRSSAEMDDEIMLHPISMPILKSSSTSETHLWKIECIIHMVSSRILYIYWKKNDISGLYEMDF